MPKTVIIDTSSLILFQKIEELDILKKIYNELITTKEIEDEFNASLPDWIEVLEVNDKKYQEVLETQLDKGEASAIALAKEYEKPLLILDDRKARKIAQKLNLKITGTLGVFNKAKQIGVIDRVKPIIDKLLQTDFRISDSVIQEMLKVNNEEEDPSY